jgi:hypothetical protein
MTEWITVKEAARRLGVHRNTMTRRIEQWNLAVKRNPRNLSENLVDWSEVEQRLQEFENVKGKATADTPAVA